MPSTSKDQRRAMAIAEHHPSELYQRNRGLLKMSHQQLHDFASTQEKDLPKKRLKRFSHAHQRKKHESSDRFSG